MTVLVYPIGHLVLALVTVSYLSVGWTGKTAAKPTAELTRYAGCDTTPRRLELRDAAGAVVVASDRHALCVSGTPDLNGDGWVGGPDLGPFAAQFGGPGSADLNGDGVVGAPDLGILASVFGARVVE